VKVDSRVRLQFRLQSGIFLLLFIALLTVLAWLTNRYPYTFDMSSNQRNSLSQESALLVEGIEYPLQVTLFVSPLNESKPLLEALFERVRISVKREQTTAGSPVRALSTITTQYQL